MSTEKLTMLAKTFSGLENVLKDELLQIGATNVEPVVRGVKFTGTKETLYKANFCCRTALRILMFIGEYKVKTTEDLYRSVYNIDWSEIFDLGQTFAINSTVNSEAFNNSMFVSLKTKDAIVDQFRKKFNKRPSVNPDNPDIHINVHASADTLTVSLDSSGESLHKRGYRVGQNEASMSEVLAAGILKIAGWKGQTDFYDTMCGSGTIPVEAALIARNIPPGMFRQEFAFEKWKDFDPELFEEIYNEDYEVPFKHRIYASDISSISIRVSEKNAKSAGVLKDIDFEVADFSGLKPKGEKGLLIINPPYGERMRERQVEPLYTMIGDTLKANFAGFRAWIFSSSESGFKNVGLRPSQKIKLYNGPLECSFRNYELYDGSMKAKKQPGGRTDFKKEGYKPRRKDGDFKGGNDKRRFRDKNKKQ
jgi:putative N6-adenine-specific DNA methylase